jgi:WD40 repeat protein/DNA-binding SARP family transcriptional activator
MEFRLLGPLEASDGGSPIPLGGPKQRTVLAHLLLRPEQLVPADRLIDEVWGEEPPATARNALQTYVSHLRNALGRDRLEGRSRGYVLHVEPSEVDAFRFEALVERARQLTATDAAAAVRLYAEALALWRAPALDDLADQPSLRPEITRLEELRMVATEERVAAELDLGRHAELIPEMEILAARHPLRERLWGNLMTALYRSGRQGDALAAFQEAREVLAEELGIDPSPELQRLHEQILRQDRALEIAGEPLRGYRLLEQVGEGAFGAVHRAFQPQVGREVAVKVIHPRLANNPEFIRRFEAEAQLVARLEHPHVVPLYDYWREPDGAYLVMRFLRGGSLQEALRGGPLASATAVGVLDQVAQALASAHRQGVVHRDVKPANILFDEEGNAYLSDFGIAKELTAAQDSIGGGTPSPFAYYLSPEELRGETPSSRADIYSLGIVLYEMLAGRHPYAGSPPQALPGKHLREPVPSLRSARADIPSSVDGIIERATAKDPEERFTDARAFASALRAALGPAAAAVSVPAVEVRNPYKGLRPFLEADAADFFGREDLVDRLVTRMTEGSEGSRLLAVVGPSGSGKSSLVRAGLVPALRRGAVPGSEGWFVAQMVPGGHPFAELEVALLRVAVNPPPPDLLDQLERDQDGLTRAAGWVLPNDRSELLLVIDQFEELFTLVDDEDTRARFLASVVAAATDPRSRVRVIITIRADFYDRPLLYRSLAELVRARTEVVVPLTPEELERAVTGPAERVAVAIAPGLVAQLVADVADQPGALPLLQYALTELFDRRQVSTLSPATYREIGGVTGALARRAEEVFASHSEQGKQAARQLFLRLVTLGEGTEDTRRRVLQAELTSLNANPAEMEAAIIAFGEARLLSFDRDPDTRGPTVEVAHEALLREWGRLGGWIDTAREDLRTERRLVAAAREWVDAEREASFLVSGSRLEQLDAWHERSSLAITPEEREYLEASLAERDRRRAEEGARQARERALERRSWRRLRALVAVLAAAALISSGLTVFAFNQRGRAEREGRVAIARELAAAAVANLEVDPERSILLALEAVERTRSVDGSILAEAEEALHRAVVASRILLSVPGVGGGLDWSPDGTMFVTEGPEETGMIDIRDAATGKSLRSFHGHDTDVNLVAFSADSSMLATTGDDGAVRVWNPATGEELWSFQEGEGEVWGPSFSPDGSLLAASWTDQGVVRLFDLAREEIVHEVGPLGAISLGTSFSPDGRRLGIATLDSGGVVVDVDSGEEVLTLRGHELGISDIDWSPDGRWVATSGWDSTVRIWEAGTGTSRFSLFGHSDGVVAADWSPDSTRLITGSADGTAKVWEITEAGARELLTLSAQDLAGGVWVAFSPDGERVMTGDQQIRAVKIWDATAIGPGEWVNLPAAPDSVGGIAFTPDGRGLVASSGDGLVTVWDPETGEELSTLGPLGSPLDPFRPAVPAIDISPDGAWVATAGPAARVWDAATGQELFTPPGRGYIEGVAWHPEGALLATAGDEGIVRIVDRSGREVAVLREDPGFSITALRFSPNGRLLATTRGLTERSDPTVHEVKIWDWGIGQVVGTIRTQAQGVAFDPTGTRIATANFGGLAEVYDLESGGKVATLSGHTGHVFGIAYSPDGTRIATGSADGTVRVWDARSGVQILVLRGHKAAVANVAFSPDGSKLASASPDGTVRVWALDLDDLIEIAKRELTRPLTDEECRRYLHVGSCRQN